MEEQEWIGIQFNLDRDMELKSWLEKYKNQGIKTDGEHITINFGKKELKRLNDENSMKINLIKSIIRKCLKRSDYTNIYTYFNAENLTKYKSELLAGEFQKPIRIDNFEDKNSILSNYNTKIKFAPVRKIIRRKNLMNVMDKLFNFVANRNFELEQN